ncbi:MAG: metallophosphoesterase family protein [Clostridia bacterium]|nr:metallophosphoesterase family protein [Clostridia bacterium]
MKKTRRFSALVMALVMLFTCAMSFTANAQDTTDVIWNSYYAASTEQIEAAVMLTPGSNESERYVSWYSESATGTVVLLDALGREIDTFEATAKATPQGDYRLGAVISGLKGPGVYAYYCKSGNWQSTTYTFTVDGDTSFTAMYMTDIHVSGDKFEENSIRDTAGKLNNTIEAGLSKALLNGKSVDLILSAGDQASDGLREEYIGVCANEYTKSIPFATVVGNHDRKSVDYRYFTFQPNTADMHLKSYVGTDYWFVKGDVLFFMIDSNNTSMADHRRFVKEAVEANPDVKWRVAVFHHDLYSGRIPSRESENQFLRLMWAPIADEFGFDLCLLGHSHYYTISNVMYNNKTVTATENGGTVTNAEGTIYMVSGSINNPRNSEEVELSENIGHAHLTEDRIYNLIDFSEDSIEIKSYTVESGEEIGSITIEKTTNEGGHTYKTPAKWYYPLIDVISFIAGFINNIGRYYDNTQLGFDIPLFEGIFG